MGDVVSGEGAAVVFAEDTAFFGEGGGDIMGRMPSSSQSQDMLLGGVLCRQDNSCLATTAEIFEENTVIFGTTFVVQLFVCSTREL